MKPHNHRHAHERTAGEFSHRKMDWTGLHKDWRVWLVVGLMLAAIATYVLTLDDSIQPGGAASNTTAAAPAPPSK